MNAPATTPIAAAAMPGRLENEKEALPAAADELVAEPEPDEVFAGVVEVEVFTVTEVDECVDVAEGDEVTVVEVDTVTDSETPEVEDSDSVVDDAPEEAETTEQER